METIVANVPMQQVVGAETVDSSDAQALKELTALELACIGGGTATVIFA